MKLESKSITIIMIVALIFLVILGGCSKTSEADNEISQWPDYYREIANTNDCKESPCCMSGLRRMVENNYLLADENENCPEGFKPNMLLCIDTLIWCEPILSDNEEELAQNCKEKLDVDCCIASLKIMTENSYKIKPETGCPNGFEANMLRCEGSYTWCEPITKTCAKEGEMISIMPTPTGELGMKCCEGLTSGGDYNIVEGKCSLLMDVAICINCPNGECGLRENKCNCPEDCE